MDKEGLFNFRPYSYTSQGVDKALLFKKQDKEINLVPREATSPKAQTLLAIISPTLLATKLET